MSTNVIVLIGPDTRVLWEGTVGAVPRKDDVMVFCNGSRRRVTAVEHRFSDDRHQAPAVYVLVDG